MLHPLLFLVPVVLAARSLAFGIQSPGKSRARPAIAAETEYEILLIVALCLTGLLAFLYVMGKFPDLGVQIAEMNQF